jgi:hypothetical protein
MILYSGIAGQISFGSKQSPTCEIDNGQVNGHLPTAKGVIAQ